MKPQPLPPFTATDYLFQRGSWPWLGLAAYLTFCNLFTIPLAETLDRVSLIAFIYWPFGSIFAQFAILPAWIVWGSRPLVQRLALALVAAVWLFIWWAIGITVSGMGGNGRFLVVMLLLIPAIGVAAAAPLAIARSIFGWQLLRDDASPVAGPLGIRHLLGFTTLVAASLALVRMAMYVSEGDPSQVWVVLAVSAGVAALVSTLVVTPIVWVTLAFRSLIVSAIVVGILGMVTGAVVLAIGVTLGGWPPLSIAAGIQLLPLGFAYTTAAAFWIARVLGYRLVIRGRPVGGQSNHVRSSNDLQPPSS